MTRINASIPPKNLCNTHLFSEYRELKRIPNTIKNNKAVVKNIPSVFSLGEGSVKWYYTRLKYLHKRNNALYEELLLRGFNVTDYSDAFKDLPEHLYNDWDDSSPKVREIVSERIKERLLGMKPKDLKYYGEQKTAEELIEILNR